MTRIAVLGAANSIMEDGWLDVFMTFFPDEYEVTSYSLASAGSLYGAYAIEKYPEIGDADFCVIDLAICDQQLLDGGHASLEMLASSFYSLAAAFRTRFRTCRPITMISPQRGGLMSENDQVRRLQRAICAHLRLPFLDIGSVLEHQIRFCGGDAETFFLDEAHLNVSAAQKIAQIMERVFRAEPVEVEPLPQNADKLIKRYPPLAADGFETKGTKMVGKSSPLLDLECRELAAGEELRLGAVPYICGLVNWVDEETGDVSVEAVNDRFAKSLRRDEIDDFALTVFEKPVYGLHGATIRAGAAPDLDRQPAHELTEDEPEETPENGPGEDGGGDGGGGDGAKTETAPKVDGRALIGDVVTCDGNPSANGAQIVAMMQGADTSRFDIALHNALFSEDFG